MVARGGGLNNVWGICAHPSQLTRAFVAALLARAAPVESIESFRSLREAMQTDRVYTESNDALRARVIYVVVWGNLANRNRVVSIATRDGVVNVRSLATGALTRAVRGLLGERLLKRRKCPGVPNTSWHADG